MSKTCAQRKKERDRDRQRTYVGNILIDNRSLYKQMTLCGFPVTVSLSEATSGSSVKWEEEKQAYLNCEKVSVAEAMNYFGSDFVLDLTTTIVSQAVEPVPNDAIVVRESSGCIQTSTVRRVDQRIEVESRCVNHEVPHADLGSRSKNVSVVPIAAEDITDIPAEGEDTLMVVNENGYLGSFLHAVDTVAVPLPKTGCTSLCAIPISVLNIMVREDPKLAQRCQLIRKTIGCTHLDGLQIIERPDEAVYSMQTLTMGKVPNERGFKFYDHFGRIRPATNSDLSATAWHFLHTLANPDVAARAFGNILRYTQHPGLRTTILYNWNSGSPKHELFPLRFSS